jgi:hypothetical protein
VAHKTQVNEVKNVLKDLAEVDELKKYL